MDMLPIDAVYREYAQAVYRYLLSQTRNPDLAEELTQETFFQAVKNADRFDGSCKVFTWLCAIAKNQLRTHRRRHPDTLPLDAADGAAAGGDILYTLSRIDLLRQLHQLEEPYRELLYLRLFGDLSFREIGEILGRTENWARVTFYRGKERLKKEMDTDG